MYDNVLIYRFNYVGLYIVMIRKTIKTVLKVSLFTTYVFNCLFKERIVTLYYT